MDADPVIDAILLTLLDTGFVLYQGRVIDQVPSQPAGNGHAITDENRRAGKQIGPLNLWALSGGEPYDLGLAVEGLLPDELLRRN